MAQPVALFDIDGTLTTDNVWNGIMTYSAGQGAALRHAMTHTAFIGLHYPLLIPRALKLLSEADFRRTWTRHLPWYFRNFDQQQMQAMADWVAFTYTARIARPDVVARLQAHLAEGLPVALVSGAPLPFVAALARLWGVAHAIGSPVEFKQGRYTGRMTETPCIDDQKAVYTRGYFAGVGIDVDYPASFAYADSYSDLGMFELVGRPVAVYPDRALFALANRSGWEIIGEVKNR